VKPGKAVQMHVPMGFSERDPDTKEFKQFKYDEWVTPGEVFGRFCVHRDRYLNGWRVCFYSKRSKWHGHAVYVCFLDVDVAREFARQANKVQGKARDFKALEKFVQGRAPELYSMEPRVAYQC
jgi:hypothetical protein